MCTTHHPTEGLRPTPPAAEPETYSAARHVARLSVGARTVLHDELRQQLFELNGTADLIWQSVTSDAGEARATGQLVAEGLSPDAAQAYVTEAARGWMSAGHIAPRAALRALAGRPCAVRRLSLHGMSLEITCHGLSAEVCDLVASGFYGTGRVTERLAIVAYRDLFLFFFNGDVRGACPSERLAPHLKATLTELYAARVERAFLAHGAMLTRDGTSLFLSGAPGAGKTTLALALAAAGWTLGADDIVTIHPDGRAKPLPFAACAKSGAWPLLEPLWPELGAEAEWLRADGQWVRYLRPPGPTGPQPRCLDLVVALAREPGAAAVLHPAEPLEALGWLIESAHSAGWALDGAALRALAARLERARSRRLVYSDLGDAVRVLEDLRLAPA